MIVLNRHGLDQVGFSITTPGDSVASCTLNDLLLSPANDYMLRCVELNAPVSGIPLFGFDTDGSTLNKELFRVKRRVAGTTLANFNTGFETTQGAGGNNFDSRFMTRGPGGQVHYNVTGFLTTLGKHANNFTQKQDIIGAGNPIPPNGIGSPGSNTEFLRIRLNADTCVEIIGTSIFWNHFCLQFTAYGIALLGITTTDTNNILALTTRAANAGVVFTMFDHDLEGVVPPAIPNNPPTDYVAPNNNIIDPAVHAHFTPMLETTKVIGTIPIFKNLDHRYFVSVETDLLVSQAIKVVDGKQTIDRSICKVFFPTTCKVLLESEDGVLREDVDFEIETHVGQYSFIRKTNPSRQWSSLQTSFDLRFFRFHLYITYRFFDAGGKWVFSRIKYPIALGDSWTLALEFISKL
jgi:hypothetical protein